MYKALIIFVFLPLLGRANSAEEKSFHQIWDDFYIKSLEQKSAQHEIELNELSHERAKRHWIPRAYISGQWFNTNDPTQVFFNNLGQRSIKQSDFVPSDLNNPGYNSFQMATLGVDLPLFEGGYKISQSSMYEKLVHSSELQLKAKKTEEYTELSRQFGAALIHSQNTLLLQELKEKLGKIITSYQVGARSNPVGHSGLLGLKGVNNRIEGVLAEFKMKTSNSKNWINKKTENQDDWQINKKQSLKDFLSQNLSYSTTNSYSTMILAQEMKLKTLENVKEMEKSRFLPRLGLFAQNNLYSGSRDNANSQAYGLYLMWDIFNSDSYGRLSEASAKILVEESKMKAFKQNERIMLDQLMEAKSTLEKNLSLLNDSENLLKEQTQNAMTLFKAGMLSALQLAEVINRRVDLISNKNQAEFQYLDTISRLYQINN